MKNDFENTGNIYDKSRPKGVYYGSCSLDGKEMKDHFVADEIVKQNGYVHKSDVEFARYKQDCRKRAMEMAHTEAVRHLEGTVPHATLIKKADDYYNWLISIPE